jgi:hypothetical protein
MFSSFMLSCGSLAGASALQLRRASDLRGVGVTGIPDKTSDKTQRAGSDWSGDDGVTQHLCFDEALVTFWRTPTPFRASFKAMMTL